MLELARIRIEKGQYQEAESTINQALRICQRCGYRLYEIDAELILAKVYLAQNNPDQAKSLLQSTYEKAERMGYHLSKIEAGQLLERMDKF